MIFIATILLIITYYQPDRPWTGPETPGPEGVSATIFATEPRFSEETSGPHPIAPLPQKSDRGNHGEIAPTIDGPIGGCLLT